jgi:GMP synthase (glutamine-hydrolysing)
MLVEKFFAYFLQNFYEFYFIKRRTMQQTQIIILDFGSQYTQLLARRIREQNILAEVIDFNISKAELTKYPNLKGIILSGGPASVYEEEAYTVEKELLEAGFPVLGVCYGLQLITHLFGGTVEAADQQEFGKAKLVIDVSDNALFENIPNRRNV